MERIDVSSSNVKSVGYDGESSTLEVEFNNGYLYHYTQVPSEIHNKFMSASSKGKFVNIFLKNRFPTERLR